MIITFINDMIKNYYKTEKGKAAYKKYRQTPKGKLISLIASHKHTEKKKNVIHDYTLEQAQKKLSDTNGICLICMKYVGINNLTLDHIIPLSKVPFGAVYTINDIQFICKSCNSRKGNRGSKDYSGILKPKKLLKKLDYEIESEILKHDRNLYAKIVDFLEGRLPSFTEDEILYLNNL